MSKLFISSAAIPFPFTALIAAASLDIPIVFDESSKDLELQGNPASNELEIASAITQSSKAKVEDPKVFQSKSPICALMHPTGRGSHSGRRHTFENNSISRGYSITQLCR